MTLKGRRHECRSRATLFEGVVFQIKTGARPSARQKEKVEPIILLEGIGCLLLIGLSILSIAWTPIFLVYVVLMIMGSWIIPLVTSYLVHDVSGATELDQTRLYRGRPQVHFDGTSLPP